MTLPMPTIDHVVINVLEHMDEAEALYGRLGFHLTPRGTHTLGSVNHLAIFGTDYLELIGSPAGSTQRLDILGWPQGLNGIVFGTEDSGSVHAALLEAGLFVPPPAEFSRPVALDHETRDAVFRTVRLPNEVSTAGRFYFCQHFNRELVWRDPWRRHPNGVVGVLAAVVTAEFPDTLGALFRTMFGPESVAPIQGGVRLAAGTSSVEVLSPAAAAARFGDAAPAADHRGERMTALVLRTTAIEKAEMALRDGDIPTTRPEPGRLLVAARDTMGVTLEFRA